MWASMRDAHISSYITVWAQTITFREFFCSVYTLKTCTVPGNTERHMHNTVESNTIQHSSVQYVLDLEFDLNLNLDFALFKKDVCETSLW